jgi:hypothetical protein
MPQWICIWLVVADELCGLPSLTTFCPGDVNGEAIPILQPCRREPGVAHPPTQVWANLGSAFSFLFYFSFLFLFSFFFFSLIYV